MKSKCKGKNTVSARIDDNMKRFLDEEAERVGVSRAELIRLIHDWYAASRAGEMECPSCGERIEAEVDDDES